MIKELSENLKKNKECDPCFRTKQMINIDKSGYVYKYIPLKYVLYMISNKTLILRKVSDWEDPYENFFLKSNFYTDNDFYEKILVDTNFIRERMYGQSWTQLKESDAMWRIYSKYTNSKENSEKNLEEIAIQVKIKVDDLFKIVYTDDSCMATTSIGKVEYKSDFEIDQWIKNIGNLDTSQILEYAKESLLIKRPPFKHEEEVRLLVMKSTEEQCEEFLTFQIKNINVFDKFVLDPRLNNQQVNEITKKLKDVGVCEEKIIKSNLYEFLPVDLTLN